MFKRNKGAFFAGVAIGAVLLLASSALAFNSSISPGSFFALFTGGNVQPVTTSISITTQLQAPAISIASTTGSLSGGPIVVEVAALTLTGTSSPSNEFATTTSKTEDLKITWPQVPGATGYAVYFGTTTSGSEQSYFAATSTAGQVNNFYWLTSTSSPTYYTVPQQGSGYYSSVNSASSSIDTTGLIRAQEQATTSACTAALNGSMFYSQANAHLWLCTGAGPTWTVVK